MEGYKMYLNAALKKRRLSLERENLNQVCQTYGETLKEKRRKKEAIVWQTRLRGAKPIY